MKALPDEEGIETPSLAEFSPSFRMKALPDEEGIETHGYVHVGHHHVV